MTNKTQVYKNQHSLSNDDRFTRRDKIIQMRKDGKSIRQIVNEAHIPETSLLRELKNIRKYPNNEDIYKRIEDSKRLQEHKNGILRHKEELAKHRDEISERRKKVMNLYNMNISLSEISKMTGLTEHTVMNDLEFMKEDSSNIIRTRRQLQLYKNGLKAAVPEPDMKIDCAPCNGSGKRTGKNGEQRCNVCFGKGKVNSFYGNIMDENRDLLTKKLRLKVAKWLMEYLQLKDWQELLTWYKVYDSPEENNAYFKEIVGEGFVKQELVEKRRIKMQTQTSYIWILHHIYELNGVNMLPWDDIYKCAKVPPGKKPEPESDAYTMEQIKVLHKNSDLTHRTVIEYYMSGGRWSTIYQPLDAVDRIRYPERERYLRIRDLRDPLDDPNITYEDRRDFLLKLPQYEDNPIYEMTVYADDLDRNGEPVQYICWSTHEFYVDVNEMLRQRQKDGELDLIDPELKHQPFDIKVWWEKCPNSPVFRVEYGSNHYEITHPEEHPLTNQAIKGYINRRRARFLEPLKKRVKTFNGFRSYVQTVLEHDVIVNGIHLSPNEVQWFMGRQLKGMGEHYDKWGKLNQIIKWFAAIPFLTIDREKSLKQTIEEKDKTIRQKEIEKQQQADIMYGISAMTKQALQESQETKELMRMFMSVLKPEEIGEIQKRLATNSSLPSEKKQALIDVTKEADNSTIQEGEQHS